MASGYERVLLAPGLECDAHPFRVYADIEVPVYQRFNRDQMASTVMVRVDVSSMF